MIHAVLFGLLVQGQEEAAKPPAIEWKKDLADLRKDAEAQKRPIFWLQLVGDLEGKS
jgi:hypothetical protein